MIELKEYVETILNTLPKNTKEISFDLGISLNERPIYNSLDNKFITRLFVVNKSLNRIKFTVKKK